MHQFGQFLLGDAGELGRPGRYDICYIFQEDVVILAQVFYLLKFVSVFDEAIDFPVLLVLFEADLGELAIVLLPVSENLGVALPPTSDDLV